MIMPLVFELITMLALCALGFVFGRLWEIRQQTIRQHLHHGSAVRKGIGFRTIRKTVDHGQYLQPHKRQHNHSQNSLRHLAQSQCN